MSQNNANSASLSEELGLPDYICEDTLNKASQLSSEDLSIIKNAYKNQYLKTMNQMKDEYNKQVCNFDATGLHESQGALLKAMAELINSDVYIRTATIYYIDAMVNVFYNKNNYNNAPGNNVSNNSNIQ